MKRRCLFLGLLVSTFLLNAQNPFEAYGFDVEYVTMTQGEFNENHDEIAIVEIGDVLFDTKNNKILNGSEDKILADRINPEVTSRFISIDPEAERYYSISPYAYCMNNPVNAIDPTGKVVVFINGMHSGSGGKSKYWGGFDKAVMKHLNDYNAIYRDGSRDGAINVALNTKAHYRNDVGYNRGKRDVAGIVKSIMDSNGNLTETIKIITHSMGGAYGKGYVQALVEYFTENNLPLEFIEFQADFAPYQPLKQKAVPGVRTLQFSHDNDKVANSNFLGSPYGEIEGAEVHTDNSANKGHPITDFMDKIKHLPQGKYKIENGQLVPY